MQSETTNGLARLHPVPVDGRELTHAELDGVAAGTGVLVHENLHAGTTPRGGGTGPVQPPRAPVRPPRSPPTGMP